MNIIGVNDTHDASCCYIKDGKLIYACAEERFQRRKNFGSFPIKSLRYLLKKYKLNSKNIDFVAVANLKLPTTNVLGVNSQFSLDDHIKLQDEYFYKSTYQNKKVKLSKVFPNYKFLGESYYPVDKIKLSTSLEKNNDDIKLNEIRKKYISKFFKIDPKKIHFFHHHRCHAFYGYYMNPSRKNTNVVTSDGGGDSTYESVYLVKNGQFKKIYSGRTSLVGKMYSSITLLLKMHPVRHHYKVMGLAPYSKNYNVKKIKNIFNHCLKIKGKSLKFFKNKEMKDFYFYFLDKLKIYRFDNIAKGLQEYTEEILVKWFKNIFLKTKIKNFVFSGGVANNIKANQKINEQKFVNNFFVPPGPGDENLSIGAAFTMIYEKLGYQKANNYIKKINHAYLAYEVDEKDLEKFIKNKYIKNTTNLLKMKILNLLQKKLKKEKLLLSVLIKWNLAQEL